jgi:hypothetical protein
MLEARDAVLYPISPPVPASRTSPLSVLRPDECPVAFRGREAELQQVTELVLAPASGPGLLLCLQGEAGVGKSRLAIEAARRLPPGWQAGWLRRNADPQAIGRLLQDGRNILLLVDDADLRADLEPVLRALDSASGIPGAKLSVRVLLISRYAWDFLRSSGHRSVRSASFVSLHPSLRTDAGEEQDRLYRDLARELAEMLDLPFPGIPEPAGRPGDAGLAFEPFDAMLARALVAVLQPSSDTDPRRMSRKRMADILLKAERPRRFLAPANRPTSLGQRRRLAAYALSLAPGGNARQPLPSLVAEPLVVRLMGDAFPYGSGAGSRGAGGTDEDLQRALAFLVRAAGNWQGAHSVPSDAAAIFTRLPGKAPARQLQAVRLAASAGNLARTYLDPALAAMLPTIGWGHEQLVELAQIMRGGTLRKTRLAVIRVTAERYLDLAPRARRYRAELASALDALDEQLIVSGQYAEAFRVAARAIPAWRELAYGSASGQAYLARSLGELSGRLAYFGRHDEALAARTEAVRIYRELTEKSPSLYRKRLRAQAGQLREQCEDRDLPYPPEARDLQLD